MGEIERIVGTSWVFVLCQIYCVLLYFTRLEYYLQSPCLMMIFTVHKLKFHNIISLTFNAMVCLYQESLLQFFDSRDFKGQNQFFLITICDSSSHLYVVHWRPEMMSSEVSTFRNIRTMSFYHKFFVKYMLTTCRQLIKLQRVQKHKDHVISSLILCWIYANYM